MIRRWFKQSLRKFFSLRCSIGKSGTLTVRTDKQEDDVTEGSSPSTFTVLELNPATTSFYLGGVPDDVTVSAGSFFLSFFLSF